MTIRPANPLETNYILGISGHLVQESSAGYMDNHVQRSFQTFLTLIQNGAYYLIDEENRILRGWILLGKNWNSMSGKVTGHIFHLYVFPEFRHAGIGKRLMQAAITECKNQNIETIQLDVFKGNPAKALYEKLGFQDVSTMMELQL